MVGANLDQYLHGIPKVPKGNIITPENKAHCLVSYFPLHLP